ncbi:hypothetical protein [Mesorhizobium sp. WSM4310]|uniref:hypothetical protein n=1 Tax=Mesorhizobium sp. WSM4310 TaxID=2589883 RepID=UPI001FEE09EB|nr:hypothetical protein [Mesorhizobium sp. WSM4310]
MMDVTTRAECGMSDAADLSEIRHSITGHVAACAEPFSAPSASVISSTRALARHAEASPVRRLGFTLILCSQDSAHVRLAEDAGEQVVAGFVGHWPGSVLLRLHMRISQRPPAACRSKTLSEVPFPVASPSE